MGVRVHEWPEDNPFQVCVKPSQWEVFYTSAAFYIKTAKDQNSQSIDPQGVPMGKSVTAWHGKIRGSGQATGMNVLVILPFFSA